MNTKNAKTAVVISVILGIAFAALAGMYWLVPAGSLPAYMPGYEAGSAMIHFKHGLGALILATALFIFAWFKSGKKDLSGAPIN